MTATLSPDRSFSQDSSPLCLQNLPNVGEYVFHRWLRNADGSPQRFKVTSVKRWKRDRYRLEIGLKRGLREFHKLKHEHEHAQFTRNPADVLPPGVNCAGGGSENVMRKNYKEYLYTFTPETRSFRYWCFGTKSFVEYSEVCPNN